jgi:hypothetical protein
MKALLIVKKKVGSNIACGEDDLPASLLDFVEVKYTICSHLVNSMQHGAVFQMYFAVLNAIVVRVKGLKVVNFRDRLGGVGETV